MTTPADALAASSAAGAEAGAEAADTTTVSCEMVRVGMFFDGTNNSRDHVGTRHIDSWHSNVDLLERIYKDSSAPEFVTVNGARIRSKSKGEYIRGVGIEEGGGNQQGLWGVVGVPQGSAWGIGPEGVAARTRMGLDVARQAIRTASQGLEPCMVWLDAFGFSRGACVARDFANDVKGGAIRSGGHTATVQFMGLFDTVSSIGEAGNMGNWADEGVRINTQQTARHIVHITAKDELRENFPLTLAMSGKRIEMVGVHSDIGGGYAPGTNRDSVSYLNGSNAAFFSTVSRKWGLTLGEWESSGQVRMRSSATAGGDRLNETQTFGRGATSGMSFRWEAEHGLQFVALKIMHDQAIDKDVPFEDLGSQIDRIPVGISGDLATYYDQIKDYPHRSDTTTERNIRRKHAHMSVGNSIGMGPEPSGTRRTSTM